MLNNENLKNRDIYLNQLIAFQDKEPVKVVTGIRRSGKSKLLQLMIKHLFQSLHIHQFQSQKPLFYYFPISFFISSDSFNISFFL